jgi:hypothetical protein
MNTNKTLSSANPFIVRLPFDKPVRGQENWACTVVFDVRPDGIYTGVALRSPKDIYDGNKGDQIAVGRAKAKTGWYMDWDMLTKIISIKSKTHKPEIPVALFRFWALEVAAHFIVKNINPSEHEMIFGELGIPKQFLTNDYSDWFDNKENEIVKSVYG